jgi:preprotein translocase subunit Sec63
LYQKHYSPELEQPQDTEKIIQESGLENIDKNQVVGDIVYLEDKNLIKGMPLVGHVYSPWIKITSYGIDFVENVVDAFVEKIEGSDTNDEVKSRIKELSKETDNSKKIKSIMEFAKTNTGLLTDLLSIAKYFLG